jgi:hypothetical protein
MAFLFCACEGALFLNASWWYFVGPPPPQGGAGAPPGGGPPAKTSLFIQKVFDLSLEAETGVRFGKDVSDE